MIITHNDDGTVTGAWTCKQCRQHHSQTISQKTFDGLREADMDFPDLRETSLLLESLSNGRPGEGIVKLPATLPDSPDENEPQQLSRLSVSS